MHPAVLWIIRASAVVLLVSAIGLWLSGGIDLPTKHPPTRFHFKGMSLALLGASLGVMGAGLGWLSFKPDRFEGKAAGYTSAIAFAVAALAFALCEAH
jgi:hypothetical protein